MLYDALILTTWALGIFLAPLVTALPPYRLATWWLWPAIRVAWVFGGGVAAGAGTARLVGAQPGGMLILGLLMGLVGMILSITSLLALARGPTQVTGRLRSAEHDSRTQWVPQAPAQRTSHTTLTLLTLDGVVELKLRGVQGARARAALALLDPDQAVTVTVLSPLRAFISAVAA